MANRKTTFKLKRSNVSGKKPTLAQLELGEIAINTADVKAYAEYTGGGTGATEVRQIGWDRLSTESGGTVNGDVIVNGFISGGTYYGTIFSGGTYYGDGSNLTGISAATDNYTTTAYTVGNVVVYDRTNALSAYTVDLTGLSNLPTDEDFQLFGNLSSTGIIYTDGLSVNGGDNTKFDLGLTQGWIVDNTTDPLNPTTQFVNFSATTAITVTNIATHPVSYIGLTGNTPSDIVQSTSPFTFSQRRDILEVGAVIHSDNTIVNVVNNLPTIGIDPTSQLYDLIDGIGYFNIKDTYNVYSPYTGLTISKTGGDVFKHGSNYENDPKNPHVKTLLSANTITFRYRTQDSTEYSDTTQIDPHIYDTGSGTGSTPTNKYTIQRIYLFPSGISRLQYGQNIYDSLSDAQAAIPTETFNVEQNMEENGLLRGFIVLRGDATNLTDPSYAKFIPANHWGDAQDTVYGDAHRTEIVNHSSTGVRSGGQLSINADTTKFDITSGVGIIVDNFTNPDVPTQQDVRWDEITGITSTYVTDTGETHTYITINSSGTFIQTPGSSGLTPQQKRDEILLGGILHIGGQILFAWERQIPITSPMNNFEDLTTSIGPFSINGNRISAIPTTLSLEKSVGDSFYFGGFQNDVPKSPNIKTNNTLSASTLVYATGTDILGPSGTTIDTDNYDPNGLGVITPSTTNQFIAHRIWHQPTENVLVFQYGQYQYNNLADARTNFALESFVTPNVLLEEAYLVAVIIARDGETNLDDPARSQIIPQGKFAGTGGGGGTSDTLQTAYDNSINPEIITDATRGPVDFRSGSGSESDNLITFQGSGGTINAWVNGLGDSSFNSVTATTISGGTLYGDGSNLTGIVATWDGLETITVGEDVIDGDLLYLSSGGTYLKTSNTTDLTSSTELRIATENILSGQTGNGLIQGKYTTTGLTQGDKYWIGSTAGSYTNIQPSGDGEIVRYIGTSLNTTTLEFMPDETWIEISSSIPSPSTTQPAIRNVSISDNITITDYTINVIATGDTTQTLPSAAGIIGKVYNIKNSGTGTITIATDGSETIDGSNGTTITQQYVSLTLQSDGTNWIII
jgi:hypothetical protein